MAGTTNTTHLLSNTSATHTKNIPVYLNVQRMMGEPANFSLHFILTTLFWAYHKDSEEIYLRAST